MVLKFKIISLENNQATLANDQQEKVLWPQDKLPAEAAVGTTLYFTINREEDTGKNNPGLAKEILNEILGTEKNT